MTGASYCQHIAKCLVLRKYLNRKIVSLSRHRSYVTSSSSSLTSAFNTKPRRLNFSFSENAVTIQKFETELITVLINLFD